MVGENWGAAVDLVGEFSDSEIQAVGFLTPLACVDFMVNSMLTIIPA